ncbi:MULTISPECIES: hypothetical protein [unclassified Serratia (in: enterobacteria)]|uniref:hypothetical protein n=1 Tax=unclassified Serratia (in: enterobacteria) TaxID=2647522 RepID=UPI000504A54F|nr:MULTISPECIES: hypothetical protein [unclassified Serratia (in: enterobacteria)]KFK94354.1 hypothetical protein JV45_10505 [Serratia sp. Ag2]KFK99521.1 hypothetical protein IV04_07195 [Serratia sp. Ag1]
MILLNKYILLLLMPCLFFAPAYAQRTEPSVVETILQRGFPTQPGALAQVTDSLFDEYERQKNVSSLIFYSYGMLKLASHFKTVNDYVKASEFAKLGFFYLDEAVDTHENNPRVRYLRARVDAYLPAELGRCVVTLHDTNTLLKENFDSNMMFHINYMQYRALHSCKKNSQAAALLSEMKKGELSQLKLLPYSIDDVPEWDINEVTQIIIPLVKGE